MRKVNKKCLVPNMRDLEDKLEGDMRKHSDILEAIEAMKRMATTAEIKEKFYNNQPVYYPLK
jgi:hypothetical protein